MNVATSLLAWYDTHGRKDLPWQQPRAPYRVWLSEVMLQQTQVATVIPYFTRFVTALPNLAALAAAPLDAVLALWSGLGYYTRARNLHRSARYCVERYGSELPRDFAALASLPGIGRSTAGAILALAHELRFPILDGNVKRVLARFHGVLGWPGTGVTERALWEFASQHTPHERIADYTQAIMDLGATVCTRAKPHCGDCPLAVSCVAHRDDLTAQLPERKPTKTTPSRRACMLLLRDGDNRILLERRPERGVWAGLWSLPETTTPAEAPARLREFGLDASHFEPLPEFAHVFSHYRLNVQPLLVNVQRRDIADRPDLRWCDADEAAALGLPAPVRKLIANASE